MPLISWTVGKAIWRASLTSRDIASGIELNAGGPDRRRRILEQAQEVSLSRGVGFGEHMLQMGSHGWLTDTEHVGGFLAA
jgi:hypothetical protein